MGKMRRASACSSGMMGLSAGGSTYTPCSTMWSKRSGSKGSPTFSVRTPPGAPGVVVTYRLRRSALYRACSSGRGGDRQAVRQTRRGGDEASHHQPDYQQIQPQSPGARRHPTAPHPTHAAPCRCAARARAPRTGCRSCRAACLSACGGGGGRREAQVSEGCQGARNALPEHTSAHTPTHQAVTTPKLLFFSNSLALGVAAGSGTELAVGSFNRRPPLLGTAGRGRAGRCGGQGGEHE